MKSPVFGRNDFSLCRVPVPSGYQQSQTHCGICIYEGRYYLSTSPYPQIKYAKYRNLFRVALSKLSRGHLVDLYKAEGQENPCLYVGLGDSNPPTEFEPFSVNPLISKPVGIDGLKAYNSDPDLYIEDGRYYLLNRAVYRIFGDSSSISAISRLELLTGDIHDRSKGIDEKILLKEWDNDHSVSPCLCKHDDRYLLTYLDTLSALDGKTFNALYLAEMISLDELTSDLAWRQVEVKSAGLLPWHMSLFSFDGHLYSIVCCVEKGNINKIWQMLGIFNQERTEMTIFDKPLTDFSSYRGSATVLDNGMFVLYNATLNESVEGGRAVDGREVMMAKIPFSELLESII